MTSQQIKHITVLVPGGILAPEQMKTVFDIAGKYNLTCYLTTAQNLRLLGATGENLEEIKTIFQEAGFTLKTPGRFPKPKVCVGMPYCSLGLADTFALSDKIFARFGGRTGVKPKYKIAVSGCPACCAGSKLVDIGIVATRNGFEVYAGGKGGFLPRTGKRIAAGLTDEEVVALIGRLADFHAAHTSTKQRIFKLMTLPDFPVQACNDQP